MLNKGEKFIVKEEVSLLDFLAAQYPQSSKSSLKKMLIHGSIELNGKTSRNPSVKLKKGDEVSYRKQTIVTYTNAPFNVVFEDESIIIIDKPAGLLTYGEKGSSGSSVYKELREYLSTVSRSRAELFVVHRLDREVSGLLMFAKTLEIQEKLKESWKEFTKKYLALTEGVIKKESGVMKSWLSDGPSLVVRSGSERAGARYAETSFQVLKVLEGYTLLELQLVTGRKNQIRVHLSDLGHPVVGDRKYGADPGWERRIRLHACFLRIRHPRSNEWMEFSSQMPRGFLVLKEGHEKYK